MYAALMTVIALSMSNVLVLIKPKNYSSIELLGLKKDVHHSSMMPPMRSLENVAVFP